MPRRRLRSLPRRFARPAALASVASLLVLGLVIGAVSAAGTATGHHARATITVTPASGAPQADSHSCDGEPCYRLSVTVTYEFRPNPPATHCPEGVFMVWDGVTMDTAKEDGGTCNATIRRDVVASVTRGGLLAPGRHTVCTIAFGPFAIWSASACVPVTVLDPVAARPSPDPQCVTPTPARTATPRPTAIPTAKPTIEPTPFPTAKPTAQPTPEPTAKPTAQPTVQPTARPTVQPTARPTVQPTARPTTRPTARIDSFRTPLPVGPTSAPVVHPTVSPSIAPEGPVASTTAAATQIPAVPTAAVTAAPTKQGVVVPGLSPSPSAQPAPASDTRDAGDQNSQFVVVLVLLALAYFAADVFYIASVSRSGRPR